MFHVGGDVCAARRRNLRAHLEHRCKPSPSVRKRANQVKPINLSLPCKTDREGDAFPN